MTESTMNRTAGCTANLPDAEEKRPPGVMLYFTLYEAVKELSDTELGALTRALMEYGLYGALPSFSGAMAMAWHFIKGNADRDYQRYRDTVMRRRNAAEKRWQREKKEHRDANADHGDAEWMKKYM